jgi:ABC-2 type transport system permease protein
MSARKDFSLLQRDPVSLAGWLGIPLILGLLMNLVLGGGEARPQGRLLVADEDQSLASALLTEAFGRDPLAKMVIVEKSSREEGKIRIDHGEASAFLIIPKGLRSAYLRNEPVHLLLFTNRAERIIPKIIQEALATAVDTGFYLRKISGERLRRWSTSEAPNAGSISLARSFLLLELGTYLDRPLILVDTTVVHEKKDQENITALFSPGIIFLALMFVANALAGQIWNEHAMGTLRRLRASAAPLAAFLAGRVLFVALIFFCVAAAGLAALHWLAHVPIANPSVAALWVVFSGISLFLLLLLLVLQASGERAAHVVGNLAIFPLALIGGCYFPFEIMPARMAAIGRWTPNGWAVIQFRAILDGSLSAGEVMAAVAGLTVVGAIAFLLALRQIEHGLVGE